MASRSAVRCSPDTALSCMARPGLAARIAMRNRKSLLSFISLSLLPANCRSPRESKGGACHLSCRMSRGQDRNAAAIRGVEKWGYYNPGTAKMRHRSHCCKQGRLGKLICGLDGCDAGTTVPQKKGA